MVAALHNRSVPILARLDAPLKRSMLRRNMSRTSVATLAPRRNKRAAQRAELEALRRELVEPKALEDRDLLPLLAYATSGDGDPLIGLVEEARAMVSLLGDGDAVDEDARAVLLGVERRLAAALEIYARLPSRAVTAV